MTLPTVTKYGAWDYGPRKGTEAIVYHTSESGGWDIASAIACATWQANKASNVSGGSYNGLLGYDATLGPPESPDAWRMVLSVPWGNSAGGLVGNHTLPDWHPERYPFLDASLSDAAMADTNAYIIQTCISGSTAALNAAKINKPLVYKAICVQLARWAKQLEGVFSFDALLAEHYHFQTDRSDAGPTLYTDVLAQYLLLYPPVPPVPPYIPVGWEGKISVFGTPYPRGVRTDTDALNWVNRVITNAKAKGTFHL